MDALQVPDELIAAHLSRSADRYVGWYFGDEGLTPYLSVER